MATSLDTGKKSTFIFCAVLGSLYRHDSWLGDMLHEKHCLWAQNEEGHIHQRMIMIGVKYHYQDFSQFVMIMG